MHEMCLSLPSTVLNATNDVTKTRSEMSIQAVQQTTDTDFSVHRSQLSAHPSHRTNQAKLSSKRRQGRRGRICCLQMKRQ